MKAQNQRHIDGFNVIYVLVGGGTGDVGEREVGDDTLLVIRVAVDVCNE